MLIFPGGHSAEEPVDEAGLLGLHEEDPGEGHTAHPGLLQADLKKIDLLIHLIDTTCFRFLALCR